jgi:carboxylate-amine ligase
LDEGNGADRQLRVFGETGDLNRVVDYVIEQTEQGLFQPAESAAAEIG